jgi:anaerobic ribonucleoside-triphosphate reductase activating protein
MAFVGKNKNIDVEDLYTIIKNIYNSDGFDGITISGGDPLEQLDELLVLLEHLKHLVDDILVYTGFEWETFSKNLDDSTLNRIQSYISVLIDGPYIQEKNIDNLPLRGSTNQKIIFFESQKKQMYEEYMKNGRQLQNVYVDNDILTVGIMDK